MVRLSLLHGICKESAFGFATYGILLTGPLDDAAGGYRIGKVAINIMNKFQAQENLAKVYAVVHGFLSPWAEPIQVTLPPLKHAIEVGLATGDTEWAMTASHIYAGTALFSGQALGPLALEMKQHKKNMLEYKQHFVEQVQKPVLQTVLNLVGPSSDPTKLFDEEMDENNRHNHAHALHLHYRMWLEFLFGDYQRAWKTRDMIQGEHGESMLRFIHVCNHTFYTGLTALVLARKEGKCAYTGCIDDLLLLRLHGKKGSTHILTALMIPSRK